MDTSNVDSVIEARLLNFNDVSEIQQRNIELLAVVRELSAGQEAAEQTRIEEKTAEVKQELDTALRQIEELRAARERQQLMVENLIQQKEMYKSIASASGQPGSGAVSKMVEGDKNKLLQELEKVKKDYAEYKEGKAENDKISNELNEKLKEDLHDAKIKLAKLSSQEEYSSEKFKIMNTNLESSKRHNVALEERNKQLHDITARHELSVTALRKELMEIQNQVSKVELQNDSLTMKNQHLQSSLGRLEAERDVLLREKNSSSRIEANLQQIQINLQRNEELGKLKQQSDNEKLLKEVELLRNKLQSEQEHFKDSVKTWEHANKTLREKSEAAIMSEKNALEQLNNISNTLETMKMELKDTTEQLQLAESRLAGRGLGRQGSSIEGAPGESGKNRLRDVELLMAQTKQELKNVNFQLNESKRRGEEYKGISEAAEKRMTESSAAMQVLQSQLEAKVKKAEEEKASSEKKMELVEIENRELKVKVTGLESEAGVSGGELRDKMRSASTEIEELKSNLITSKQIETEAQSNASKWLSEARETQEKYEREIVQHARDIEALSKLKQEIKNSSNSKVDIDLEKKKHENEIKILEEKHLAEISVIKQDKTAVDQQLSALSSQNENLLAQLERVSKQLTDMTATGLNTSATADSSMNTSSVSINEEEANNTQLMAIIKYLRQEKEILSNRVELMQAESARVQSQMDHQVKLLAESEAALDNERSSQSMSMMSASKHSELIRKVETLSAITDSNRMLREEKEKVEKDNEGLKLAIAEAEAFKGPMGEKLKQNEERVNTLVVEKIALQTEADKWKTRSDQLVEKSFKINPKELQRLQESETRLTKQVASLETEKKASDAKINSISKEMDILKTQASSIQAEKIKLSAESSEKQKELALAKRENAQAKNIQSNLQKENNGLKKKTEELVKLHNTEIAKIKKEAEDSKSSGSDEVTTIKKQLEEAQAVSKDALTKLESVQQTLASKEEVISSSKTTNQQLKKIGQTMRAKFQAEEKKVLALSEEKSKLEAELAAKQDAPSEASNTTNEESGEAAQLIEAAQARLEEVESHLEETTKEKEELEKKFQEKEKRAKDVLQSAKTRINKVEGEKKALQEQLDNFNAAGGSGTPSSDEQGLRVKAMTSQLTQIRQDKERLEAEAAEAVAEKVRLLEQFEALQQELVAAKQQAAASASKPVAVAGLVHVHQQEKSVSAAVRKQQQPQVCNETTPPDI